MNMFFDMKIYNHKKETLDKIKKAITEVIHIII